MPYLYKEHLRPEPWREVRKRSPHPIAVPFLATNYGAAWLAYLLSRWSFLEVLEYAGSFSVLIAVIFYFADAPRRRQARHDEAWQVINTAQGKGGSGGRIEALASLNDDHVPLVGLDVSGAFLEGVRLPDAELRRADFREADLKDARLAGANLESSDLRHANFRAADLRGTILRYVDLGDVDLVDATLAGADLAGATLDDADLTNADLADIANWQQIKSCKDANIHGVHNAPDGFIAWALKNHAVDTAGSD